MSEATPISRMWTGKEWRRLVALCLTHGGHPESERARDELQANADHLAAVIAGRKAKPAALKQKAPE